MDINVSTVVCFMWQFLVNSLKKSFYCSLVKYLDIFCYTQWSIYIQWLAKVCLYCALDRRRCNPIWKGCHRWLAASGVVVFAFSHAILSLCCHRGLGMTMVFSLSFILLMRYIACVILWLMICGIIIAAGYGEWAQLESIWKVLLVVMINGLTMASFFFFF